MGKTIIQTIGPLYGEVVNGTVFGRPNGSIYVPSSNTVTAKLDESTRYIRNLSGALVVCASDGTVPAGPVNNHLQFQFVAESQDIQNYIEIQVSDSDTFETVSQRVFTAGLFNNVVYVVANTPTPLITVEDSATYYIRAVLISASNVPVATSDAIELKGVVVE